jgi:hypothetical protein
MAVGSPSRNFASQPYDLLLPAATTLLFLLSAPYDPQKSSLFIFGVPTARFEDSVCSRHIIISSHQAPSQTFVVGVLLS